jgi:hypothetical protein
LAWPQEDRGINHVRPLKRTEESNTIYGSVARIPFKAAGEEAFIQSLNKAYILEMNNALHTISVLS